MAKIVISESQLKRLTSLVETGANNAAMDLDIYVQPVHHDTSHGSENAIDTMEDMISKLQELIYMLKSGKKVGEQLKSNIYKQFDDLNQTYSSIKEKV